MPVHVAFPGGGVVNPLVARAKVGDFGCVDRNRNFLSVQNLGVDLPEGLVGLLGVAHFYLPQLERHRVGVHMKWPCGGCHEVIGDSGVRQDSGERAA